MIMNEDINYWMSKCASLQQEVDVLNEKLANISAIKWQTGEPKEGGLYVVTNYKGEIEIDRYEKAATIDYGVFAKSQTGVRAWYKLSDIKPYQNKEETK